MFDGYTVDHSVFSGTEEGGMVKYGSKYGETGERTFEDSYEVLTDCPLAVDENDVEFAGFGHCGVGSLGWSDYVTLYDAMHTLIDGSQLDWFSASTYKNMNDLVAQKDALCSLVLACDATEDENSLACSELEVLLEAIVNDELDGETAQNQARAQFPNLGKPGKDGSVTNSFQKKRQQKKGKKENAEA